MLYDKQLVMSASHPGFLEQAFTSAVVELNGRYESLQCQVLLGLPRRLGCLLITLKNISSGFHLHIVHRTQAVYRPLLNACCQHFA